MSKYGGWWVSALMQIVIPGGHVITVAYLADETGGRLKPSSDAREAKAFRKIPCKLAFDHRKILHDALELANTK